MPDEDRDCLRRCFSTPDGRRVLGMLLIELGFFDQNKTPEQMALTNFAKSLLRRIGFTDKPQKIDTLVNKLFEIGE